MLHITRVFWNSKGHAIAAVGFDADRGEWRINIHEEGGFGTEEEAVEVWNSNFDQETGRRLPHPGEEKKASHVKTTLG